MTSVIIKKQFENNNKTWKEKKTKSRVKPS